MPQHLEKADIDMMLTKEGGVCVMIGVSCCTHILTNTAPEESVAKTLEGLTTLSNELAENSGINDPFTDLIENWFGRWKGWMTSMLTSLINGWSFNFSSMLHNSLCLRTSTAVN
jgi:hypothetical protein